MRNNRKYLVLLTVSGYLLYLVEAVLLNRWLVGSGIGMDELIAFLVAQMLGVLLLYFMRRGIRYLKGSQMMSHEYGGFLLINAIVLIINLFLLYVRESSSAVDNLFMQLYGPFVTLCANIILQIVQDRQN